MIEEGNLCENETPWHQYISTKLSFLQPKWIGGFTQEGRDVTGFDTLKEVLGQHFDLVEERNVPFVIRETIRKHQWTVAHATVWKRKQ